MLSLQAKSSPLLVHHSTFSLERAIEEVSGIKLYTGLIGQHTQDSSAGRFVDFCGIGQFVSSVIDNPVLVVSAGDAKRLMRNAIACGSER